LNWAGNIVNIPTGYLFCNGDAVNRATYADLFAIIAVKFGAGDGSTTFNLPDTRDVFVVGAKQDDAGIAKTNITGSLLLTGGSSTHTHTYGTIAVADHAAHTHAYGTIAVAAHGAQSHTVSGSTAASSNTLTASCIAAGSCLPPVSHTHGYGTIAVVAHSTLNFIHTVSGSTNSPSATLTHTVSGATASEANIPPFIAFPAIIKT